MLSQTVQSIFDVLWGHGVELGAEKGVGGWHRCAGYPATVAGAQGETHQEEDGLRGSNLKLPAASAADCRCKPRYCKSSVRATNNFFEENRGYSRPSTQRRCRHSTGAHPARGVLTERDSVQVLTDSAAAVCRHASSPSTPGSREYRTSQGVAHGPCAFHDS